MKCNPQRAHFSSQRLIDSPPGLVVQPAALPLPAASGSSSPFRYLRNLVVLRLTNGKSLSFSASSWIKHFFSFVCRALALRARASNSVATLKVTVHCQAVAIFRLAVRLYASAAPPGVSRRRH